jgi:hypothetical protein
MKKVKYFSNKNVITLVRADNGQKVDWAHIIFNNLCSGLDLWYMLKCYSFLIPNVDECVEHSSKG